MVLVIPFASSILPFSYKMKIGFEVILTTGRLLQFDFAKVKIGGRYHSCVQSRFISVFVCNNVITKSFKLSQQISRAAR